MHLQGLRRGINCARIFCNRSASSFDVCGGVCPGRCTSDRPCSITGLACYSKVDSFVRENASLARSRKVGERSTECGSASGGGAGSLQPELLNKARRERERERHGLEQMRAYVKARRVGAGGFGWEELGVSKWRSAGDWFSCWSIDTMSWQSGRGHTLLTHWVLACTFFSLWARARPCYDTQFGSKRPSQEQTLTLEIDLGWSSVDARA